MGINNKALKWRKEDKHSFLAATTLLLLPLLLLSGCSKPVTTSIPSPRPIKPPVAKIAKPQGLPVQPKNLLFTQDGLHNRGTIAMLLSWANNRPEDAAALVRRQADGSYIVSFRGVGPIPVTDAEFGAADKSKMVRTVHKDVWSKVVLMAFVKLKSGSGRLDFTSTDWIYAGEIASCLTGGETGNFEIKEELQDASGKIRVGKAVPLSIMKEKLDALRGKPTVAYSNRRIHIWAVMGYDPKGLRVLVRNLRRLNSEWISLAEFRQRFQLLVYSEA